MEKLELKHLAPYLPYGLKYATLSDDDDNYYINLKHNTIGVGGNQSNVTNICLVEYSKPIYRILLRPLSDLTKKEYRCLFYGNPLDYKIDELPYRTFTKLLELHFDVFHLIPQGLAIDINSLK